MNKHDPVSQIEQTLIKSHRNRPRPAPDADWQALVMADIRKEKRIMAIDRGLPIPVFVWRFAAVSCGVAAILSWYTFSTGIGLEQLFLQMVVSGPFKAGLMAL